MRHSICLVEAISFSSVMVIASIERKQDDDLILVARLEISVALILLLRSFPTSTIRVSYLTFTPLAKSCPRQPWLKFGKGGKGAKSDLEVPPNQGRPSHLGAPSPPR